MGRGWRGPGALGAACVAPELSPRASARLDPRVVKVRDDERPSQVHGRWLYPLIAVAAAMSLGHHVDHAVRGTHVGWPLTAEITPFTYSLAIYPLILLGLSLYRSGRVGVGYWTVTSGAGALLLVAVHFGPTAVEPPRDIITEYEPELIGWIAFAWLVVLVAVLVATFFYEARLWRCQRALGPHHERDQGRPSR